MDGPCRSDSPHDLRVGRCEATRGWGARRATSRHASSCVAAPEAFEVCRPCPRPRRGNQAHLPGRPDRSGRAARPARPLLEPGAGQLQRDRRTDRGGCMTAQAQDTTVRTEIVVEAPIDRAFQVFTHNFDRIKTREHNMLSVEIAESVFEPHVGGRVYDRGVDGSECQWAPVLAYEP